MRRLEHFSSNPYCRFSYHFRNTFPKLSQIESSDSHINLLGFASSALANVKVSTPCVSSAENTCQGWVAAKGSSDGIYQSQKSIPKKGRLISQAPFPIHAIGQTAQ
jgi:hypothetical protein